MDLYQPSGVGKKRRKKRSGVALRHQGEVEYFYPVGPSRSTASNLEIRGGRYNVKENPSTVLSAIKRNGTASIEPVSKPQSAHQNHGKSADIEDNVGLTVIIPGG